MARNRRRSCIARGRATKCTGVVVTDHALLRYLERCHGLDVEGLRRKLAPECLALAVEYLGDGIYPGPRCRLVVSGRVVKTVLPG